MALAENIIKLRKQANWSQEALAAQIGVSRQSVSKWESGHSTPDIAHILTLATLFEVSTDKLLGAATHLPAQLKPMDAETCESSAYLEHATGQAFLEHKTINAATISEGVIWCIAGPSALFLLLALSHALPALLSKPVATGLGLVALLGLIGKGASFLTTALTQQDQAPQLPNVPFNVSESVKAALEQQLNRELPIIRRRLSAGLVMFVLCSAPLIMAAVLGRGPGTILLTLVLLLAMIASGLYFVIPASARRTAFRYLLLGGDLESGKDQQTRRIEQIAGVYWPLLVAAYACWSLWTMEWGITWIVFPVGSVAFMGVVGLSKLLERNAQ